MRDIRARISQRHGIELTDQQIQELAARRLEVDPRSAQRQAGAARAAAARAPATPPDSPSQRPAEPAYTFEDTTLYESHRGLLRFIRRLLNPLLKLFFNPNPLIRALNTQARLNTEAAAREAERDRRQAEWNALHYEILQRLVTEVSRVSLEMQSLSMRVESLVGEGGLQRAARARHRGPVHQAGRRRRSRARTAARRAAPATSGASRQRDRCAAPANAAPSNRARRRRASRRKARAGAGAAAAAGAERRAGRGGPGRGRHPARSRRAGDGPTRTKDVGATS